LLDQRAHVLVLRGILLLRPGSQHVHLRTRLLERHTGFEAADAIVPVIVAILVRLLVEPHSQPELRVARRKPELGRHDAENRVRLRIHQHLTADDAGIAAKLRPPQSIAEHQRARRAVAIVIRGERSANHGLHAQSRE
jgi:hypothetical protein